MTCLSRAALTLLSHTYFPARRLENLTVPCQGTETNTDHKQKNDHTNEHRPIIILYCGLAMSHSRKLSQRQTTATVDLRQAYFDTILISY